MTFPRRLASAVLFAALAAGSASAMAQSLGGLLDRTVPTDRGGREPPSDRRNNHGQDRREDHRALSDAVRRVERRTGGQVLSAERVPFDGRDVNRVKVVDASGRVRVYMDDPQAPPKRQDGDDD